MATVVEKPRIVQLADLIQDDIRHRGLQPGDAYLTVVETARMLHVNTSAVNSALQLLAQRGILERKPRKGACVARRKTRASGPSVKRVHLVVHRAFLRTEGMLVDGTIVGLQRVLPAADIQFNFAPPDGDEAYIDELITQARRSPAPEGFVLVRSTLLVQRRMAESGLPVVIAGSRFPSITGLPWVDRDQRRAGAMLTEHVVGRGHRKVVVLLRERTGPGDAAFLEGVTDVLGAAGMPIKAFAVRNLPADEAAVQAEVEGLLTEGGGWGIVARNELLALGAARAVENRGQIPGRDVAITIADVYRRGAENPPMFPYIRSVLNAEEIGTHLGRLLAEQACGLRPAPDHEIIGVSLVMPDAKVP